MRRRSLLGLLPLPFLFSPSRDSPPKLFSDDGWLGSADAEEILRDEGVLMGKNLLLERPVRLLGEWEQYDILCCRIRTKFDPEGTKEVIMGFHPAKGKLLSISCCHVRKSD